MPLTVKKRVRSLLLQLEAILTITGALALRNAIDEAISRFRSKTLVLDFSEVTFMDSSGVGLVLGRYRNICAYGGELELRGLSLRHMKIMKLSGIEKIAKIKGGEENVKAAK